MKKFNHKQQQNTYDCGPTCVSILIKQKFKIDIPTAVLEQVLETKKEGTSILKIKTGLQKLGIRAEVYKTDKASLMKTDQTYPLITQIQLDGVRHYVVLWEYHNAHLIISDPLKKKISSIPFDTFCINWNPIIITIEEMTDQDKLKQHLPNLQLFKCLHWITKHFWKFLFSWISSLLIYATTVFLASMYSAYYDVIIPNKFTGLILNFFVFYATLALVRSGISFLQIKLSILINNSMDKELTNHFICQILKKPYKKLEEIEPGETITVIRSISLIRTRLMYLIQAIPIDVFITLYTGWILYKNSSILFLLVLIPIMLYLILMSLTSNIIQDAGDTLYESEKGFNSYLIEMIQNSLSIKRFASQDLFLSRCQQKQNLFLKASNKFIYMVSLRQNLQSLISTIFSIALFAQGTRLIISNDIAEGTLLVFNALALRLIDPFQKLAELQINIQQGRIAQEKYYAASFHEIEEQNCDKKNIETINSMEFKNIKYSYYTDRPVLSGVSCTIVSNENVLISGDNGSGKTTLGKVMAGLYEDYCGEILINGINVKQIEYTILRDKICYIDSAVEIFNDSIKNNILLGRDYPFEKLFTLLSTLGWDSFFEISEKNLQMIIGDSGVSLSLGQRQIINIARALISEPQVLIMDEIVNGLDAQHI